MYYRVQILFCGEWHTIGPRFSKKDDAEWQIAMWRHANGSNNKDTGFRTIVERLSDDGQ
jgi:hypothetical protein